MQFTQSASAKRDSIDARVTQGRGSDSRSSVAKLLKFHRSDSLYYRTYLLTLAPLLLGSAGFGLYLWLGAGLPWLALSGLLVLLAGLALTLLIAADRLHRLKRPVTLVNRALRRLHDGELDVQITNVSQGEMGELETGFNAMARKLATAQARLQERINQANQDVEESMEVIEIRNAELDLARRRAIDASRVKTEFLANMSHEIRTPMNGVLGFTRLLSKTKLNDKQRDFLATIQKSADSLLRIVNEILDFSQLESGKLVLTHEPFRLRECIEIAVTLWTPQAHNKHLELVSLIYSDVPDHLVGDETRIIQIINNLIGNAVKFTDQGEIVVRVMLEEADEHRVTVTISVSDTGIGIPLGEQQNLFLAFHQGSATTNRLFGGTGLGLSICSSLAEAMGGSVEVSSHSDEGSVFRATLKLDRDPDAPPIRHAPPLNRRGLLIDGHDLSRIALRNALTDMGLAVDDHANLPEPTDADFTRYALIAVGCNEEESVVADRLHWIRECTETHTVPVIALVSSSDEDLLARFAASGAVYCLSKPPPRRHLHEALRTCLRSGPVMHTPGASPESTTEEPVLLDQTKYLHGKLCLVADDHPINLRLITHLLSDAGARVLQASNGVEAVSLAKQQKIDMAFLDVHMPDMNGLEAARGIRALNPERTISIIALTADAAEKNQLEIARAGIDRYLIKPVNEEDLRRVLHEMSAGIVSTQFLDAALPQRDWPVRDRAQALRIAGGSDSIASKLFEDLCAELPKTLATMRDHLAQEDWEKMWQVSHRLHGATAVCGVPALYHALGDLQPAITLEDEATVSSVFCRVEEEAQRLLASES